MAVNKEIFSGILQATRLTRAGRLGEATALIQQTLGARPATAAANHRKPEHTGRTSDDVIDVEFSDAEVGNRGELSPQRAAADGPSRHFGLQSFLRGRHERQVPISVPSRPRVHDEQPGQFISGSYANAAGARPYKLYVPTAYAEQPLALVVMLHGCTQTPDDFANGTRMNALAEERQCFVLYPAQTNAANQSRCWNWFKRGDQHRDQGEPAILAGMTREIISRYGIDQGKVYVAGLSAGGAMAAVLAAAYPELYAAAGVHSGLACGSAHDLPSALSAMRGMPASTIGHSNGSKPPAAATPTIVFHGDRDKTVHPRNGEQVISQLAGQNGAANVTSATERGQVPGGHAFTRTVHSDLHGRIVLEHWSVHGGGHAWFGGSPSGSYVDAKGPDAAREMMRFFHQYRL
jgi:poly(hydroxyalkanoate) depolymerase family esterase